MAAVNSVPGHPALLQTAHRPWPLPTVPWAWRQVWLDLAFIHFVADADELRRMLPPMVELDLFEGEAWVGIVPFRMEGVTKRGWPAPALISNFAEINVRTYVTNGGKPGVWFFSLDVVNPLVVWAARRFFHLPYHRAKIEMKVTDCGWRYSLHRGSREFDATYSGGDPAPSSAGDFPFWATERYCLYSAAPDGRCFRAEVQHAKWPLQTANLDLRTNTMCPFGLGERHPGILFSPRLDVVVWPLEQIN